MTNFAAEGNDTLLKHKVERNEEVTADLIKK
jgi:hypothetical protein